MLIVRNTGPRGYPGMPEVGNLPLPRAILQAGTTDMVRISDARMSGTSYGTVVLHVSPEAAVGGPLAAVRTGDRVRLDVESRTLSVDLSDDEIARRLGDWSPPAVAGADRGWTRLYVEHVRQAHEGADLDFLEGGSGHEQPLQAF